MRIANARALVWSVLETGEGRIIPCESYSEVHSLVSQLNKWRQQIIDSHPELEEIAIGKRQSPPRVEIKYNAFIHHELLDLDGNPTGETLADYKNKEQERQLSAIQEEAKMGENQLSDKERFREIKKTAEAQGISISDILPDDLTYMLEQEQIPQQEQTPEALAQAARQKGRELTEEEKQQILYSIREEKSFDGNIF